ncbi:MAG TPA: hypothetical protein VLL77_07125 [Anaerolineales bacterium]|nr:hypothetical protein [Anaerolineales bacterium]
MLAKRATKLIRLETLVVLLAGLALGLVVFLGENRVVGFEPGYNELQPGHHGWVSSHTLAIISHASWQNAFVGYALAIVDEYGQVDFDYFDRTPVFFSAGMHTLLSFWPRLSTKVYLAKQAMNGIFLLTLLAAFGLIRTLTGRNLVSVAVPILAASSRYLLFYKDMVHYDQPALLGTVVLMFGIAQYAIHGRRWLVYATALFAVSLGGHAFAALAVLGVWFALEVIRELSSRTSEGSGVLRRIASLVSLRVLSVSVVWAALNFLYNVFVEANKRGVSLTETSIVQSAFNRLALNPTFNESYQRLLDWDYFLSDQVVRAVRWIFPVWNYEAPLGLSVLLVICVVTAIVLYGRSLDPSRRLVLTIMAVSGPAWLFVMRNLSAFHDYTAMLYLGMGLAFYTALLSLRRIPRGAWILIIALSVALFGERNLSTQAWHVAIGRPLNVYTYDFMRIAESLPGPGQAVLYQDGVPYAPYAAGFYLPDQLIAPPEHAQFTITRDSGFADVTLTPANDRLFLFRAP